MKNKILAASIVISAIFFAIYLSLALFTLEVETNDNTVKIKTLFLGEYFSSVKNMEIYEEGNNKKVVTFNAKHETSKMHTVTIFSGSNSFRDKYLDSYNISYPTTHTYKFKEGLLYQVIVKWSFFSKKQALPCEARLAINSVELI